MLTGRSSQGTTARAVPSVDPRLSGEKDVHTLLDSFDVGVILHGPRAEIRFANKAALDMSGMTQEQLSGRMTEDLGFSVLREDGSECPFSMRPVPRAIDLRQPVFKQVLGWRRTGGNSVRWTQVTAVPQFATDGTVTGAISTLTDITERKQAELTLADRTTFLNSLIERTPLAVVAIRADHTVQMCNPAFEELFRYRQEEILGRPLYELLAVPELRSEVGSSRERLCQGKSTHIVTRRGRSDGTLVDVEGFSVPLFAEGRVTGAVLLYQDITERKNMEAALQKAAELNRQILLSAQEGIAVHDRELRYALWNPYMERMSRLKASEVIGKHPLEVVPCMMKEGMYADLEKALAGEIISSHDTPYTVPRTNERGWAHYNLAPLRDDQGNIIGVVAAVRDITERKHEEEQLRKSEAQLSQAEQLTNSGSWDLDLKTGKWTLSDNLRRIHGLSFSQGKWDLEEYWARVHPEDRRRARADVERAIAECKSFEHTVRFRTPDGTYRVLSARAIQIPGPNGRTERSIGVAQDITDQTRKEEELRQLSGRLLQLQDEERRRIARDLHDSFSQSLVAINLGLTQLGSLADVRSKRRKQVLTDVRRIVRGLSREIRSLSYLLHPPLLDELGLAAAVEEYVKGFGQRSGIDLELEMKADFGRLPVEYETALFRIVQESLANVQRHSGSSTARMRLTKEEREIVLEITDSGRGMRAEDLHGRPVGPRTLGVGILGMSERMRQLGGRLEISSSVRGTTVRATLPLPTDIDSADENRRDR
ncbi:MAG TPA: PAS domain S-box protein [Candidatus Acidoferrum sp.]|nr:PAS domain S-box protein [Candidatus Acidoferrum sp.]